MSYVTGLAEKDPLDFFLVAHEADEAFASQLYDEVHRDGYCSIFYHKESTCWGEIEHSASTEAFRRAKWIIIIVSETLLNASSSRAPTDVLIGAALRCEKKILTVFLDVTVEMVKEKQCFLTSYKSVMAFRNAVRPLAASILDVKRTACGKRIVERTSLYASADLSRYRRVIDTESKERRGGIAKRKAAPNVASFSKWLWRTAAHCSRSYKVSQRLRLRLSRHLHHRCGRNR